MAVALCFCLAPRSNLVLKVWKQGESRGPKARAFCSRSQHLQVRGGRFPVLFGALFKSSIAAKERHF